MQGQKCATVHHHVRKKTVLLPANELQTKQFMVDIQSALLIVLQEQREDNDLARGKSTSPLGCQCPAGQITDTQECGARVFINGTSGCLL